MSEPSPLVVVRCRKCQRVLGSLDAMPDDWSGNLTVMRCPKCVRPSPRRLVSVLRQQQATDGFALMVNIPLAQLRHLAEKARKRRRAQEFSLPPITAARW